MWRCGGTFFLLFIAAAPSASTHRSFLIHTDRVFSMGGGGDDFSYASSPQWRCTLSGTRGHQGPLCVGYQQVASDGTTASCSRESGRAGRGGGEKPGVECSQKRWREVEEKKWKEGFGERTRGTKLVSAERLAGAPQEECTSL